MQNLTTESCSVGNFSTTYFDYISIKSLAKASELFEMLKNYRQMLQTTSVKIRGKKYENQEKLDKTSKF